MQFASRYPTGFESPFVILPFQCHWGNSRLNIMAKGNSLIVLLVFVKVTFISLAQLISPLSSLA